MPKIESVYLEKIDEEQVSINYDGFLLSFVPEFNKVMIVDGDDHWLNTIKKLDLDRYKLIRNATTKNMFCSLTEKLDELCFTEEQVYRLCEQNRGLIRPNNQKSLFLLKKDEEYFICILCLYSVIGEALNLYFRKLEDPYVWGMFNEEVIVYTPRIA